MRQLTTIVIGSLLVGFCLNTALLAQSSGSSPFYDLRNETNEASDTTTDTEVQVNDGAEVDTGGATDTSQEDEDSTDPEGGESDSTEKTEESPSESDQTPPSHQPENETSPGDSKSDESDDATETKNVEADETADDPTPTDSKETTEDRTEVGEAETLLPLKEPRLINRVDTELRETTWPDTVFELPRASTTVKSSDTRPVADTAVASAPWYKSYHLLVGSLALGGLGIVGLWMLGRRRKVRIIKTANKTANKYLNMNRSDTNTSRTTTSGEETEQKKPGPEERGSAETVDSSPEPDQEAEPTWDPTDEELKQLGIDPQYRSVIKMHFQDGLSPDQIAQQTDFGEGEVGLALDLAERVNVGGRS